MRQWVWATTVVLMASVVGAQALQLAPASTAPSAETAPLGLVIAQVKAALDQYQKSLGGGADSLPPLASAEFDFKTTTSTTVGGTINLFIFKIGGSHENDVVNDVVFTYSVPPPPKTPKLAGKNKPPTLTEALARTIQEAAAAVKNSSSMGKVPFTKLTVNLQYGVKWDGIIGANVPVSFVTVGLSGDKNRNTVQSVKLIFGQ